MHGLNPFERKPIKPHCIYSIWLTQHKHTHSHHGITQNIYSLFFIDFLILFTHFYLCCQLSSSIIIIIRLNCESFCSFADYTLCTKYSQALVYVCVCVLCNSDNIGTFVYLRQTLFTVVFPLYSTHSLSCHIQ